MLKNAESLFQDSRTSARDEFRVSNFLFNKYFKTFLIQYQPVINTQLNVKIAEFE